MRARDVLYLPHRADGPWGVFDHQDRPLPDSVDRRGPEGELMGQTLDPDVRHAEVTARIEEPLLYGGRLIHHYGHFLVETLPRLWPLAREGRQARRILIHCVGAPEFFDNLPYAAAIFRALGLGRDDFVLPTSPVRIDDLLIPRPAFRQQAYAYRMFRELGLAIGATLGSAPPGRRGVFDALRPHRPKSPPVYLSKRWLTSGVQKPLGEAALDEALEARGVQVVHPELMLLEEQVRLFDHRLAVMGSVGSAFHTSLFAAEPGRLVGYNPGPALNSNFALLDALTGADGRYFMLEDASTARPAAPESAGGDFSRVFDLPHADGLADALLAEVERR